MTASTPSLSPLQKLLSLPQSDIVLAHKAGKISDKELVLLVNTLERERCKSDLFFLAKEVLNYSQMTESVHRPLCQVVESVNEFICLVASGEHTRQTHTKTMYDNAGMVHNVGDLSTNLNTSPLSQIQHNDNDLHRQDHLISNEMNINVNENKQPENDFGGGGGGGSYGSIPTQNLQQFSQKLISHFSLPDTPEIRHLIDLKVIQFNPESRTRLFLLFRGAFKSTIITIAHTIQLMLIWPDIRILIASHKKEGGSQKFLGSIKDHFLRNERFRQLFPEYCPKPNTVGQIEWGTSEQVTLPNRSASAIYPEATIEIAGNTTDVTGRHYDYLKIDDIVTRESVTNESMLEKTEEFNALLTFLFNQPEWGIADYAGTCYHFADLYSSLRNSNQITKFILPVWDEAKNPTIPERFTTKGIEQIRNHPSMTSYQFCTPGETPIWMADGTFKYIEQVEVGDEVIGFLPYRKGLKRKLVKSKVLNKGKLQSKVQTVYLENGDVIRCTPDHQWFTGRTPNKGNPYERFRKEYKPVVKGSRMVKVIDPIFYTKDEKSIADWNYLAAIIDGEGSCKHISSIQIHQSIANSEVCKRIEETLNRLGIKFTIYRKNAKVSHGRNNGACNIYTLQSSRQMRTCLINYGKPAKASQIMKTMLKNGGKFADDKIKVIDIKKPSDLMTEDVFWLETETGNYTAWGYASKNSAQYLMNPVPQEDQVFRPEYFSKPGFYYETAPSDLKMYVLVDPANAQKKESDYTALISIGIDSRGDLWFIDIIRDKLTLDGRAKLVSDILIRNKLHVVYYESIGFQSSDIKSIKEMGQQRDWYISVNEVKASKQSKQDRIRGLQYYFEQGKVHWPKKYSYFSKYHNREYDMVEVFKRELWMFPSCEKDDLADCSSFILRTAMIKSSIAIEKEAPQDAWEFWMQTIRDAKKKPTGTFTGHGKGFNEIPSQKSWR